MGQRWGGGNCDDGEWRRGLSRLHGICQLQQGQTKHKTVSGLNASLVQEPVMIMFGKSRPTKYKIWKSLGVNQSVGFLFGKEFKWNPWWWRKTKTKHNNWYISNEIQFNLSLVIIHFGSLYNVYLNGTFIFIFYRKYG